MADVLRTKCAACNTVLRARESCPTCAERRRAEVHSLGLATTRGSHACKHIEWDLARDSCMACGIRFADAQRINRQRACEPRNIEVIDFHVRKGDVMEPLAALACTSCHLYGEELRRAVRDKPVSTREPPTVPLWYPPTGSIPCKCGGWISHDLLHEGGSCGPKGRLVADGCGGLVDPMSSRELQAKWDRLVSARDAAMAHETDAAQKQTPACWRSESDKGHCWRGQRNNRAGESNGRSRRQDDNGESADRREGFGRHSNVGPDCAKRQRLQCVRARCWLEAVWRVREMLCARICALPTARVIRSLAEHCPAGADFGDCEVIVTDCYSQIAAIRRAVGPTVENGLGAARSDETRLYKIYDADRSNVAARDAFHAAYDRVTELGMRGKWQCNGCGGVHNDGVDECAVCRKPRGWKRRAW